MILHLTASSIEPIRRSAAGDSPYQPLALKADKYGKFCLSHLAYTSALWLAVFPVLTLSTDCTCSQELMAHYLKGHSADFSHGDKVF